MEISGGIVCSEMYRLHHELLLHQGLWSLLDGVRGMGGCGVQGHQETLQKSKRWVTQSQNTWWEVECMWCSWLFPQHRFRVGSSQFSRQDSSTPVLCLSAEKLGFPSGSSGHFPVLPSEPCPSTAREPFLAQQEWDGTKGFLEQKDSSTVLLQPKSQRNKTWL